MVSKGKIYFCSFLTLSAVATPALPDRQVPLQGKAADRNKTAKLKT